MKLLLLALGGTVLFACLRATLLWSRLRRTLEHQAAASRLQAFNRISSKVAGAFGARVRSRVPRPDELADALESFETLCGFTAHVHRTDLVSFRISTSLPRLRRLLGELKRADESFRAKLHPTAAEERAAHAAFLRASRAVRRVLNEICQLRALAPNPPSLAEASLDGLRAAGRPSASPSGFVIAAGTSDDCLHWVRAAENFVAMRTVTWIHHVLDQIRRLVTFALSGAVMLVCAVSSYPLQSDRFVTISCGSLLVLLAAATLRLLLQLRSNETLRRLNVGRRSESDASGIRPISSGSAVACFTADKSHWCRFSLIRLQAQREQPAAAPGRFPHAISYAVLFVSRAVRRVRRLRDSGR